VLIAALAVLTAGCGSSAVPTASRGPSTADFFSLQASSISFPTFDDGYVAIGNRLLATTDAATTWSMRASYGATIREVDFLDEKTGWILTWRGLYVTTDGARTSSEVSDPSDSFSWVSLLSARSGYAIESGKLFATIDGGRRWTAVATPIPVAAACFSSATVGFVEAGPNRDANSSSALGFSALFATTDAGAHWVDRTPPSALASTDGLFPEGYPLTGSIRGSPVPVSPAGRTKKPRSSRRTSSMRASVVMTAGHRGERRR
jgi:photosystem II stability/assembly factor-like uncharacterized protein